LGGVSSSSFLDLESLVVFVLVLLVVVVVVVVILFKELEEDAPDDDDEGVSFDGESAFLLEFCNLDCL